MNKPNLKDFIEDVNGNSLSLPMPINNKQMNEYCKRAKEFREMNMKQLNFGVNFTELDKCLTIEQYNKLTNIVYAMCFTNLGHNIPEHLKEQTNE